MRSLEFIRSITVENGQYYILQPKTTLTIYFLFFFSTVSPYISFFFFF